MKCFSIFAICIVVSLVSCQKEPVLSLTGLTSIELKAEGGSETISFKTNRDWTVNWSEPWVRVTPSSGNASEGEIKVTITCDANTTYESRKAVLHISVSNLEEEIFVTQTTKAAALVTPSSCELTSEGQKLEIKVQVNTNWYPEVDYNSMEWIEPDPEIKKTKGLESFSMVFNIKENETGKDRTGKINVRMTDGPILATISVTQKAKRIEVTSITLNKSSLTLQEGDSKALTATVKPDDATDKTVTWSSTNKEVASVDDTGTVTAIKEGSATITATAGEKSATCIITVKKKGANASAVDLGLSQMWASCNLGASSAEEYGDYYAWGETSTKNDYSWSSYKWCNGSSQTLTKYNTKGSYGSVDNKTMLELEDDIAYVELGEKWRLPTKVEWTELLENCTWSWESKNGVNGYVVLSKLNGNSIFLPAAGYRFNSTTNDVGSSIRYYSSSLVNDNPTYCWAIDGSSGNLSNGLGSRYVGGSIRPVCSDKTTTEVEVTSISLNKSSLSLVEGESETLIATVSPNNATDKTVTWNSSDKSIATVSSSGKVTAVKAGTAKITAKAGEKTATCTVTVTTEEIAVTSVKLDKTTLNLTKGKSATLVVTVKPDNATNKTVSWSSSNMSVATVDSNGKVTSVEVGTTTVTAKAGDKTATCTVTVTASEVAVTSVTLDKTTLTLTEGETATLKATISPSNATNKTVTWSSSNTAIASVDANGKVTAHKEGLATVTVKAGEKTCDCTVSVNPKAPIVTEVSLNKTSLSLSIGESETLKATIKPEELAYKTVEWFSNDQSIATVSSSGRVKALKVGTTTIMARVDNATASCIVTVVGDNDNDSNKVVVTAGASDITEKSAWVSGFANLTPEMTNVSIGIIYSSTTETPYLGNGAKKTTNSVDSNNMFRVKLENLSSNTTYYYQAFVRYGSVYHYGEVKTFVTKEVSATILTESAVDVGVITSRVNGKITLGATIEDLYKKVWFYYSTEAKTGDELVRIGNKIESSLETDGSFSSVLKRLNPSSTVFYMAVAKVYDVYFYGEVKSFVTQTQPSGVVDMGLSVLWATTNIDASSSTDYGGFYAWGEIKTKPLSNYNLNNYKWYDGYGYTKYNTNSEYGRVDNTTTLEKDDDVASVTLKGSWRIPTFEEWEELRKGCSWIWKTINGVQGYQVTSKVNGNIIFLPAAGYITDGEYYSKDYLGSYWSSTLFGRCDCAKCLIFTRDEGVRDSVGSYGRRINGTSIRPVIE